MSAPQTVDDIVHRILQADPKIKHVIVADSTGTLITYISKKALILPYEELASISGSVLSELETLGTLLGLGNPIEDLREYEYGIFLYHPIEDIAIILVIGEHGVNLGLVRTMLRKYAPEIKRILSEKGIGVPSPDMKELSEEEIEKLEKYMSSTIERFDISFRGSFLSDSRRC